MKEGKSLQSSGEEMELTIRRAHSGDIKALVNLEMSCAPEDITWGARDFFIRLDPQSPTRILVAVIGEEVVGYCAYTTGPDSFYLLSVVVKPENRKKGVGSCLIHALCHIPGPQNNIVVFARESNLPYHLFLQSLGFICTKTEREYFHSPDEDALRFIFSYQLEEQEASEV